MYIAFNMISPASRKQIKSYYANTGWYYDYMYDDHIRSSRKLLAKIIEALKVPSLSSILDACCGAGNDAVFFLKQGFTTYASDLSNAMVSLTSNRIADECHCDAVVLECDALKIQTSFNREFDLVSFRGNTIAHIAPEDHEQLIDSLLQVTKTNGHIILDYRHGEVYQKSILPYEQRGLGFDKTRKNLFYSFYWVKHNKDITRKYRIKSRIIIFNFNTFSFKQVKNLIEVNYVSKSALLEILKRKNIKFEIFRNGYHGLKSLETIIIEKLG